MQNRHDSLPRANFLIRDDVDAICIDLGLWLLIFWLRFGTFDLIFLRRLLHLFYLLFLRLLDRFLSLRSCHFLRLGLYWLRLGL